MNPWRARTQEEMASRLGAVREVVGRALRSARPTTASSNSTATASSPSTQNDSPPKPKHHSRIIAGHSYDRKDTAAGKVLMRVRITFWSVTGKG